MSPNSITWVGMDAHKNSIKVAAWLPGQGGRQGAPEDDRRHGPRAVRLPVGGAASSRAGHAAEGGMTSESYLK